MPGEARAARIDMQGALARMGGSRELLSRLIDEFREKEADVARSARALADAGRLGDAIQRVHTAKGTAMFLGLEGFSAAALLVEKALRRGDVASCAPLWDPLAQELAAAVEACGRERVASAEPCAAETSSTPIPRESLALMLTHLSALVDRNSMEAIEIAVQIGELLQGTCHANTAREIAEGLYRLDFRAARRCAAELTRELSLAPD